MKNTHSRNAYKPRPAGSLKQAVTELIQAVGGLERAATLSRVSTTSLQKYADPDSERQMPVDVVGALEAAAGQPIVTTFLAAELGCAVESVGAGDAIDLGADMATAMREAADVMQAGADALADGVIEPHEAGRIVRETDQALQAMQKVRDGARQLADVGET